MVLAASDSSARGHLILKSHKPLPSFACAIPVPHPDSSIQQLRSTIVAILTGQVSAADGRPQTAGSRSGSGGAGPSSVALGVHADGSALSYSEHLKLVTIHEWRMKSVTLELRQNALIAPETRNSVNQADEGGGGEEAMSGFELQDEHECGLLEHGDEVNIWLRSGQEIDSLRLPKLSSRHVFGLPNQPTLDRSGTLLGNPPPYSPLGSDFAFTPPPSSVVREPAEPSSHSSSVSAHPDAQFETSMRHWAPPNHHRVVVVGGNSNHINNDMGVLHSNNGSKPVKKEKPRRLNSTGYFSPHLMEQKQRESLAHHRSYSGPPKVLSPTPATQQAEPVVDSPTMAQSPLHASYADPPRSPPIGNAAPTEPSRPRQSSMSKAEKEKEKIRRAGIKKMPSDALVVGPGVQGKVGRMASFGSAAGGERPSSGGEDGEGGGDAYGNLDAFVSFTAASSDVHQLARPQAGRVRRPSNRSGTSDRTGSEARSKPMESRRASASKTDKKPVVATLTSRSTPDALPAMPMPKPIGLSDSPPQSSSTPLETPSSQTGTVTDSAPEGLSPLTLETPGELTSSKGLSKAERRYQEVKRALDAEKDRQAQEEMRRRAAALKREADKVKAMAKLEEEQREKKEALKWQVWEEVRARQAKEKAQQAL